MQRPKSLWFLIGLVGITPLLAACGREVRDDTLLARTGPNGADDRRIPYFDRNAYQIGQGGRYAGWYGCNACHGQGARGVLNLGDAFWRYGGSFPDIYASIAERHTAPDQRYGERIPIQQLWQITAYVRNLAGFGAERIRRQSFDQAGEPEGRRWTGPLR
ncbi:cytochrome c [Aureimonas sp. AU22]|uniref:c-type cytochrome n=1 Tax=Aureimonas sp. AU22 TaxID=1638162 RepID=UPI0007827A28|nr:cytochrome c [Aureimonas sp. AU22]